MTRGIDGSSSDGRMRPPTAMLTDGFDPALSVGSARPAVFRSSTYVFSSPEAGERAFRLALGRDVPRPAERPELIYARLSHPNAEILEQQLLALEPGAAAAAVFNSGMAAISALALALCAPGHALVYTTPIYGGTAHLMAQLLTPLGITPIAVPAGDTAALRDVVATTPDLDLVLIETPANPTLRMTDIGDAARAAHGRARRPIVVVDNTFLGPTFQHPLVFGADLVVYSATKYLSGFSDLLGGVILGRDAALVGRLRDLRGILGSILQPDECWMLAGRLPTVGLRMRQQSKNTRYIVRRLIGTTGIERIVYPTLIDDPEQRRITAAQCESTGAVFSLELSGGKPAAFDFLRHLRIFRDAVSLGGVESLACHPATTTHSELEPDQLARSGVSDGLVRLSVGLEDPRDLLEDVQSALRHAAASRLAAAVGA